MNGVVNDHYEVYYLEKFWELVPAIYRQEDGLANPKDVLRSLITVMSEQAAILRRSQDRLWEDEFIELCDDWAVPYIGALVATRLLSAQNPRGQRIDVANTIFYRRRKGTPRILEQLISDISGWKGKLVESFHRLSRHRHGLDPFPAPFAGRFTGTMPGGIADLRYAAGSALARGPFDEYHHTPDFRRPRGADGRFGISKLNFHLYLLVSYEARNITPFSFGNGLYTFDPSGRTIPLFIKDSTPSSSNGWEQWHSALEWELPLRMRCMLLADVYYQIKIQHIDLLTTNPANKNALRKLVGILFKSEAAFLSVAGSLADNPTDALRICIIDDCGKNKLWPDSVAVTTGSPSTAIAKENIVAGNIDHGPAGSGKELMVDAEMGRLLFTDMADRENVQVLYHYGFSGPYGAGFYDRVERNGFAATRFPASGKIKLDALVHGDVMQVNDSLTYLTDGDADNITTLIIRSATQQRPFVQLGKDWIFSSGTNQDSCLEIDGLWIGSQPGIPAPAIVFQGDFDCIIIRNCTIDPGGTNAKGIALPPVQIRVEGNVRNFCISNSITGPVAFTSGSVLDETLKISDSIVQSIIAGTPAVTAGMGRTDIRRCTIFGSVMVHRLYATDTIISMLSLVTDTQTGCFRFSAAPESSRLPRPYESFLFDGAGSINYWFSSSSFGQPGYGQLSDIAPAGVYRGAENGAEMGVFNKLINAIKQDGLLAKIEEYMPFGLIPALIHET